MAGPSSTLMIANDPSEPVVTLAGVLDGYWLPAGTETVAPGIGCRVLEFRTVPWMVAVHCLSRLTFTTLGGVASALKVSVEVQ